MMDDRWISELNSLMKPHTALCSEWNDFLGSLEDLKDQYRHTHQLCIERVYIEGQISWDKTFTNGLNWMESRDTPNYELYYLIKLCLTGKNNLSHDLKDKIEKVYLQFNLDQHIYTSQIRLEGKIRGTIYSCDMDEALSHKPIEHHIIVDCKTHKELQEEFKSFFSQKLYLPYLKNIKYQDGRLSAHSITFATYFTLFSLDSKRPFKVFSEPQSRFWRKRVIQVLLGLQGIPFLSYFQTVHSENLSLEPQVSQWRDEFLSRLSQSKYEELSVWKQRVFLLSNRKEKLMDLKQTFSKSYDEQFHLDIKLKIDQDIEKVQSRLQHHLTKEALILQEIQHLGGDFQPHKRHKRHLKANKQQFPLFKPKQNQSIDHKMEIDELIGDYYLNLSQIEVLQSDLEDLVSEEERAFNKNKALDEKRSEEIQEDINQIDKEVTGLLVNEISHINTAGFEPLKLRPLLDRDLKKENEIIRQCIDLVKRQFRDIHMEKLNQFLLSLKENLNTINSWKVHSVQINKDYVPTIIYEDYGDFLFSNLPDEQKWFFTLAFYGTLLQFSLVEGGLSPSLLILDLANDQKDVRVLISRMVNVWKDVEDRDYQIIII